MNANRPLAVASWLRALRQRAAAFIAAPASPRPLGVLRIGLAAVLLLQAMTLAGSLLELYGSRGMMQWLVSEATVPDGVPRLRWIVDALSPLGVTESACIRGAFLVYLASLVGLLAGWRTRSMAVQAWFTHLSFTMGGNLTTYGVDTFANIALFYCVWMPVGCWASADVSAGRASAEPTAAARLALRVLQIHLCVVYLTSGIEKAFGEQWHDGEAIWRALMRSDLGQFDFTWLAAVPGLAMLLCWSTLVLEIGYAFFVWPRRTRTLWAVGTIGLHAGIAVTMGLWSFSAVMIVLTTSAFLVSATQSEPEGKTGRESKADEQAPPGPAQGERYVRRTIIARLGRRRSVLR
jgi:hypothetical protein